MKNILFTIVLLAIFTNCKDSNSKTINDNNRFELVPEPDKEERLKNEVILALKNDTCKFSNPDISINTILIRDQESANKIIGNDNTTDLNEQYHFYSKLKEEILTLNQHPGDGKNDISIFKIQKASKKDNDYKVLEIENFESEKSIKLGVSKEFVITKLGNCYREIFYSDNYTELFYRIETPNDSSTKLLEKHNTPVYYASYKFIDNLCSFDFNKKR